MRNEKEILALEAEIEELKDLAVTAADDGYGSVAVEIIIKIGAVEEMIKYLRGKKWVNQPEV